MADTYKRKEDIISADMDGETVMMDIMTGKYYNLGKTGGAIWNLIEEPATLDKIVDALMEEYDVERSVCKEQTKAFLDQCVSSGLVIKG